MMRCHGSQGSGIVRISGESLLYVACLSVFKSAFGLVSNTNVKEREPNGCNNG